MLNYNFFSNRCISLKFFIFLISCLLGLTAQADSLISTINFGKYNNIESAAMATNNQGLIYIFERSIYDSTMIVKKLDTQGNEVSQFEMENLQYNIVVNKNNEIYGLETYFNNNRYEILIKKYSSTGAFLKSWKISSKNYSSPDLAIDSKNRIYLKLINAIYVYNDNGSFIKKINGYYKKNNPKTIYPFTALSHISINGKDDIVLSDSITTKITRIISINDNGKLAASPIDFKKPVYVYGIANDKDNYIYLVSSNCRCIQKLDLQGNIIKKIGQDGSLENQVSRPISVKIDKDENLLILDSEKYRIQKFNRAGQSLWTYGDQPEYFKRVTDFAVDSQENIYILDADLKRIQKFSQNGSLLKVWKVYGLGKNVYFRMKTIKISPDDKVYTSLSYYNKLINNYESLVQVFSDQGIFMESYSNNSPNFDQQGNVYHLVSKLQSGQFKYYLQKNDFNGNKKEFALNLYNAPCTESVFFDSKGNVYIESCYSWNNYGDSSKKTTSRALMSACIEYISKINPENGDIIYTEQLDAYPDRSCPTINGVDFASVGKNIAIDNKDRLYKIYMDNKLLSLDENLKTLGEINELTRQEILFANNKIYGHPYGQRTITINTYQLPSTLTPPAITNINKLPIEGEVEITWQDKTDDETGFRLKRCIGENCQNFETIATLAPNTTSVKLLKPSDFKKPITYRFSLTALKDEEESLHTYPSSVSFP